MRIRHKSQIFLVAAACVLALAVVRTNLVKAQPAPPLRREDAPPNPPRPLIPSGSDPFLLLQSPDAAQRDNALVFLLQGREDEKDKVQAVAEMFLKRSAQRRAKDQNSSVDKMIDQMGNPDDQGAKDAVILLGEFRSVPSIPFLIDHLTLRVFEKHLQTTMNLYPCVGALVEIGSPSLDPLLARVAQTDDPETTRLAAYVFVEVLGNPVAVDFIEDRRGKLTDPVARRRLKQLEGIAMRTKKFP